MSDLNPFYAVTAVVFAMGVLLAVLRTPDRRDRSPARPWSFQRYLVDRVHRLAHLWARRLIDR
jgi:hypothetical protein